MNNTHRLHALGQSLWLDNISRPLLDDGSLRRYIDEFSVTGLTSHPTIFDEAIGAATPMTMEFVPKAAAESRAKRIRRAGTRNLRRGGRHVPPDLQRNKSARWRVSMELSPLLVRRHCRKCEGSEADPSAGGPHQSIRQDSRYSGSIPAIEESIFSGIPVNVTLLFSREQYWRPRRLHARDRAAHCGRARRQRRLCRFCVRQPLGPCGHRQKTPVALRQ